LFKKVLEYAGVYWKTTYVVQQGAHDELISQGGIYRDFVTARESSRGWSRRKAAS
jgi:hypothetical protein